MRRVHYAWVVAAVGFVTLITAAGFRSTTGVLIVPLQNEFGWSRATIGVAVAINLVLYGLGGPFSAALVERFGVRRVTIGALLGVSAGSSLTVLMTAPWQLDILWGVVNGLATGAIAIPLAAIIANRWFVERRGLVTGVLTASSATGQLIFLPRPGCDRDALGLALRVASRSASSRSRSCCRSSRSSCATGRPTSA